MKIAWQPYEWEVKGADCPLNFPDYFKRLPLGQLWNPQPRPKAFSSAEAPLWRREAGKKEKENERDARAYEEPLPIVPRALSIYARGVYLILGVQDGAFLDRRA